MSSCRNVVIRETLRQVPNGIGRDIDPNVFAHTACLPVLGVKTAAAANIENPALAKRLIPVFLQHLAQHFEAACIDFDIVVMPNRAVPDDAKVGTGYNPILPVGARVKFVLPGCGGSFQRVNSLWYLVPGAGLEPALDCSKRILSPQRLPIPPPGHDEQENWRLGSESNRRTRSCSPLHNHSAT